MKVDVGEQRREAPSLGSALIAGVLQTVLHDSAFQEPLDQPKDSLIADPNPKKLHQPLMIEMIEEAFDVDLNDVVDLLTLYRAPQLRQRLMLRPPWSVAIAAVQEFHFIDLLQHSGECLLD